MSKKYPLYKTTKSNEIYDRAVKVIPAGVYGHLGAAEGQFIPVHRAEDNPFEPLDAE